MKDFCSIENTKRKIDAPILIKEQQNTRLRRSYFIANKVELINLNQNKKEFISERTSLSRCNSCKTLNSTAAKTENETIKYTIEFEQQRPKAQYPINSKYNLNPYFKYPDNIFIRKLDKSTMSKASSFQDFDSSSQSLIDTNKIHLFVKAGQDGRSQGACPFCQDVFIQLLIKAQTNKFNFDVIAINLDNPPKEFKELCIKPPVLIHGSSPIFADRTQVNEKHDAVILSDVDEIAEYLDQLYPNSKLNVENKDAKNVCLNVFSKFSFFIRDLATKSTSLEIELEKIDDYLKENTNDENKYLSGSSMTALDCSLLPKLQHIRIAAESLKKFKIPNRFIHLWRYLQNAYKTEAFQKSCPPDREIIWHWSKTILDKKNFLLILQETPYKTLSLPDDLKW